MTITTTLNRIRDHGPCTEGWTKLLKHLGKTQADDEPVSFLTILESNGVDDCMWCFRAEPQHEKLYRKIALKFVRDVVHLADNNEVRNCLEVIQRHIEGNATESEMYYAGEECLHALGASWMLNNLAWAARNACRGRVGTVFGQAREASRRAYGPKCEFTQKQGAYLKSILSGEVEA